jgi:hypothetical protein
MNYIEKANIWYNNHKDQIDDNIKNIEREQAPNVEDLLDPKLWKSENWKWFLNRVEK